MQQPKPLAVWNMREWTTAGAAAQAAARHQAAQYAAAHGITLYAAAYELIGYAYDEYKRREKEQEDITQ